MALVSNTKSGFTTPFIVIASKAKQSQGLERLLRFARNDDRITNKGDD